LGRAPFTYAGWIARGYSDSKVNLRLNVKDVSVAGVLAEYGIAERWRAQRSYGEIRMGGRWKSRSRAMTRAPRARASTAFPGPISTGPVSVVGSLLAINAEASGSVDMARLQIGNCSWNTGASA